MLMLMSNPLVPPDWQRNATAGVPFRHGIMSSHPVTVVLLTPGFISLPAEHRAQKHRSTESRRSSPAPNRDCRLLPPTRSK